MQALGHLRPGTGGILPRKGRGIGILFRFFAQGGRRLVLRVPLAHRGGDGLRTAPVHVLLQPDGDVLVSLPRDAVDGGLFDAGAADRLAARLRELAERTSRTPPLWGFDALQVVAEVGGFVSGTLLTMTEFAKETVGNAAHGALSAFLLALPVVIVALRPWLVRAIVPRLLRLGATVGRRFAAA
ncbi:hypothetical protein [Azospirillum soli]|uniref:hypothetical protein n=1 Tax=Azospirillum soli TaxID=1304799 RepID=UPI001AEB9532|nr:hypothetical protein [Azospirillum soli]MBP2315678.1 hypothetical protein [Azospirillum soli]